ncbi:predicted protein [Streptomyces sviceus ATCC 29083]|uniref:Secreted protein n=1 Tax=Streptomyces sviceus (strain ATCC 29083 / DSM 924 / JCM 4929 / NBRC 13980 / NCIMB 11184 / NRRL 5439 / UC 5370) TaxID=463191 RepID=B5HRM6_STRX2|nr:predicted protein [Streptomyces sviceus ATCC 29083]
MDVTRRQLGRLAAVGAGALVLPHLLPPSRAAATVPPAGTWGDQGDGTLTYGPPITQNAVCPRTTWDANGVSRSGTGYVDVDSGQYAIATTGVCPVRQRAQRQGRRRPPCVERGRHRRRPVKPPVAAAPADRGASSSWSAATAARCSTSGEAVRPRVSR